MAPKKAGAKPTPQSTPRDGKAAVKPNSKLKAAGQATKMANAMANAPTPAAAGKPDAPKRANPDGPGTKDIEATVLTMEMSNAVHAAAKAARDKAQGFGLTKEQATEVYNAAATAAILVLDPSGESSIAFSDDDASSLATSEKIENALARAVKQNAVRTMDIFRDWDQNGDGQISKAEFRKALRSLGVEGGREDHDELFDSWDVDGSGAIDYKELDKALGRGSHSAFMRTCACVCACVCACACACR